MWCIHEVQERVRNEEIILPAQVTPDHKIEQIRLLKRNIQGVDGAVALGTPAPEGKARLPLTRGDIVRSCTGSDKAMLLQRLVNLCPCRRCILAVGVYRTVGTVLE